MTNIILVASGGAIGASLRFLTSIKKAFIKLIQTIFYGILNLGTLISKGTVNSLNWIYNFCNIITQFPNSQKLFIIRILDILLYAIALNTWGTMNATIATTQNI